MKVETVVELSAQVESLDFRVLGFRFCFTLLGHVRVKLRNTNTHTWLFSGILLLEYGNIEARNTHTYIWRLSHWTALQEVCVCVMRDVASLGSFWLLGTCSPTASRKRTLDSAPKRVRARPPLHIGFLGPEHFQLQLLKP